MAHTHQEYVDGCFTCKLGTLQWGRVPGGARSRGVDLEQLKETVGPDLKRNEQRFLEGTEGYGVLRWHGKDAYHKDRKSGDWQKMQARDWDKLVYGSGKEAREKKRELDGE